MAQRVITSSTLILAMFSCLASSHVKHTDESGPGWFPASGLFVTAPCPVSDLLQSAAVAEEFDRSAIMLDEDFQHAAGFTALGNIYLVSRRAQPVRIWNWNGQWTVRAHCVLSPRYRPYFYVTMIDTVFLRHRDRRHVSMSPKSTLLLCVSKFDTVVVCLSLNSIL